MTEFATYVKVVGTHEMYSLINFTFDTYIYAWQAKYSMQIGLYSKNIYKYCT
jgi:hypothetical protein